MYLYGTKSGLIYDLENNPKGRQSNLCRHPQQHDVNEGQVTSTRPALSLSLILRRE